MSDTAFSEMQTLKRRLFAMRNGALGDSLRKAGCPYRIIFGLNLPQLNEIAAEYGYNAPLAEALRADSALRESALLAPMLTDPSTITEADALRMAENVRWPEDADILCFKLLRHTPFAGRVAETLTARHKPLSRYTGLRLFFTTVNANAEAAKAAAIRELARADALSTLASMLKEEAEFVLGE